jgi:hypothetical protein
MTVTASTLEATGFAASAIDTLPAVLVGDGCTRRDLLPVAGVRAWIVDMAPGAIWPQVDEHPAGEAYVVLRGEVIEGDARFGVGTCVTFAPGSRHRPRTETGVRLYGFNPTERL